MPRVKEAAGVLNSTFLMFYLASPSCRVLSSHRDFIEKRYVDLKKANSNLPILIRECSDVQPKLWARYAFGQEKQVSLNNLNADQVNKALQDVLSGKA